MNMPDLRETAQQPLVTTTFKGFNHNAVIEDGEMFDMRNLSGDQFPLLSVRKKRHIMTPLTVDEMRERLDPEERTWDESDADYHDSSVIDGIYGIKGKKRLVYLMGGRIHNEYEMIGFYNDFPSLHGQYNWDYPVGHLTHMKRPPAIVSIGAYICIWPYKIYFNTEDKTDFGSMEHHWDLTPAAGDVQMSMCRVDGSTYNYNDITVSSAEPSNPTNGKLWIDTSGANHVLKQYSAAYGWTEVASTYVRISATGIGAGLREYDGVDVSGLTSANTDTNLTKQVDALNGSDIIYACGDDYIVVAGLLSQAVAQKTGEAVSVNLNVPDLDYVCEANNRLWGCKFGKENGEMVNEIRASKLGDFRNWSCFMGLSTDSYTASVGTSGPWTGCVSLKGNPIFFKENCIHRVSGTAPSNFSIDSTMGRGVQYGSAESIVVANERILYKSDDAIMSYDGSTPQNISGALGRVKYEFATAGYYEGKYYISMKKRDLPYYDSNYDNRTDWHLFVYDTSTGLWHKEDSLHVLQFAATDDELYAVELIPDETDEDIWSTRLISMTARDEVKNINFDGNGHVLYPLWFHHSDETDLDWAAIFGIFGTDYTGQKYLSRINLRMQIEPGAKVHLYIQYDQDGEWHDEGEIRGMSTKTFLIPVVPRRCDHLQLKLQGHGECKIYALSRMLEVGSDG